MAGPIEPCPRCGSALDVAATDGVGQVCRRCNVRFVPAAGRASAPSAHAPPPPRRPHDAGAAAKRPPTDPGLKPLLLIGGGLAAFLLVVVLVVAAVSWPRGAAHAPAVAVVRPQQKDPTPGAAPPPVEPVEEPPVPRKPSLPQDDAPLPPAPMKTPPPLSLPPPELKPPAPPDLPPSPPDLKPAAPEQQPNDRITRAVRRGVAYLKARIDDDFAGDGNASYPTGLMALAGLALLESGVAADDPAVRKATDAVRENAGSNFNTYEISLCVWFLDRLGDPKDEDLIRDLAKRLVAGQGTRGLWDYNCQPGAPGNDLSLTQFAVLGLWVARKHKAPVDAALRRIEGRCRAAQESDGGWSYEMAPDGQTTDSMTCAGLMVLAVGRAVGKAGDASDPAVSRGLLRLNEMFLRCPLPPPLIDDAHSDLAMQAACDKLQPFLQDLDERLSGATQEVPPRNIKAGRFAVEEALEMDLPADLKERLRNADGMLRYYDGAVLTTTKKLMDALSPFHAPTMGGYEGAYTLWSLERMAVVYDFKTVAGHDWYDWGARQLVAVQNEGGAWDDGAVGTSLALLFLKRANVAKDLTARMQELGPIKDVILDKTTTKSPGEAPAPKPGPGAP